MPHDTQLLAMDEGHIDDATEIMTLGRSEAVGDRTNATLSRHFKMKKMGLDDGRRYFVWMQDGRVAGISGLHHYSWGPRGNVWLAYFGVHPDFTRLGIGSAMLGEMQRLAKRHFRRFFIETNGGNNRAHRFYQSQGFREAGTIEDYHTDGSPMKIFVKDL